MEKHKSFQNWGKFKKFKTDQEEEIRTFQKWERPTFKTLDSDFDNIIFQLVDINYTVGKPLGIFFENENEEIPIIKLWGTNDKENSFQINVYGVMPYLYVQKPVLFKENDCEIFLQELERLLSEKIKNEKIISFVLNVEIVQKTSIYGYSPSLKDFIKITLALPKYVPTVRDILESSFSFGKYPPTIYPTFESDIPFILRWMIDSDCLGPCWIEIPKRTWSYSTEKNTFCQAEINVLSDDMIFHKPEGEWGKIAPLRIFSFDIECANRKGIFPEPEKDAVIQIANRVTLVGESEPFINNCFTLKSCDPIIGSEIHSFEKEKELLETWAHFFRQCDPDIVIGYNIDNFDFPYLLTRAETLKIHNFSFLGRASNSQASSKDTNFSSKAFGTRNDKETTLNGRFCLDILKVIRRDFKLRTYSLNAVSQHFLGEQKEDIHHSIINDLFNGSSSDRRRLAVYCIKDAYLPQRLLDKLMIIYNYFEMARVTGIPLNYLLSRGQSIKVISQLYRKANALNMVIPYHKTSISSDSEDTYEGATVFDPKIGFYTSPIATLDFTSLYPSIMIAHNLCYSSLLKKEDLHFFKEEDYTLTPNGDYFIKPHVKQGVLPQILEDLLKARKQAKIELANEKDPFKKAILDGRQLAMKMSANSVYGFTGAAKVGKLPCEKISASVTAYGRNMIMATANAVTSTFTLKNGYPADAQVIYGDTVCFFFVNYCFFFKKYHRILLW